MIGDSFQNAMPIANGQNVQITLSPTLTMFYFRLDLIVGNYYRFESVGDEDTYSYLYDSSFNELQDDDDGGEGYNTRLVFKATEKTMYISIRTYRKPTSDKNITINFGEPPSNEFWGLEVPSVIKVGRNETFQIPFKILPETISRQLIFNARDESIITVNNSGLVTGVGYGRTIIEIDVVDEDYRITISATVAMHEGLGTSSDPFLVYNAQDLENIRIGNYISSYFEQVADIDLSSIPNFQPIYIEGGGYDGKNYKISNLTINLPDTDSVGLFKEGTAQIIATLKNIKLVNVNIIGRNKVGALVGSSNRDYGIENCSVTIGKVEGNSEIGGLIGRARQQTRLENLHSNVTVLGVGDYVGGLIGHTSYSSSPEFSSSKGDVRGRNYVGGLVGYATERSGLEYSHAEGNVNGGDYVGGLVGYVSLQSGVRNTYAKGSVTGSNYVGGLVGYVADRNSNRYCYSIGRVIGTSNVGGLIGGVGDSSTPSNSYYDTETSQRSDNNGRGIPKTTVEMKRKATFESWDFDTIWYINEGASYPYFRHNIVEIPCNAFPFSGRLIRN